MHIYKKLPGGVNLVEYESGLAQAVADMWNASGDSWGGDSSIRTAADVESEINGGAYINVYITEKDGEALGFASLKKYYHDENALYLHVLNVRPDYHGAKLGKALVLQCVERTIELGCPRLDIHTWAGNTKSVPLYKKCGYMWEDRVDSTHLVNFIPTVIATEACRDFFKAADWYADSARVIEIKPDGVKFNNFEVFTYAWEKDGHLLKAGFERTGRRMRLLETDAFRIELTAEYHELAFGLDYSCVFEVVNKTDAPLPLRIQGKNDGNIRFDYSIDTEVTGTQKFDALFFVGEITEPQNIWRPHPCVLADVYINGKHAALGMGIEAKWPVEMATVGLTKIPVPGAVYDCYFNLTSNLRSDAEITLTFPDTPPRIAAYDFVRHTEKIKAQGKSSFLSKATAAGYGYEAIPVEYSAQLWDGREVRYTRTFHANCRGFTDTSAFETEDSYIIQNGLWQFCLNKNGAYGYFNHSFGQQGAPGFPIGRLGDPFTDEFERMKPVKVHMEKRGEVMVMEASYHSNAFTGAEYTSVYTLTAAGVFTRKHKVTNTGADDMTLKLLDETHLPLRRHTIIPYAGQVQTIKDGMSGGAVAVDINQYDENWAFEDDPRFPSGICWPPAYKLSIRWGDGFFFEHSFRLEPGGVFETEPITVVSGQFFHYNDFRDFARQSYTVTAPVAVPHIDWRVNGGNPFITPSAPEWTAELFSHRSEKLDGEISVTAGHKKFTTTDYRAFTLPYQSKDGIAPVKIHLDLNTFKTQWTKALFVPRANTEVTTEEKDGVFSAANGVIAFKADPRFSDACFSLTKDGHEWLMSRYPSREPFSWFNPFIGGLNAVVNNMRNAMTIRENITAAFARETDALGNEWTGIATTVAVNKFEPNKGISYTQYYLTLPGIPVLCYFMRLRNNTGLYQRVWVEIESSFGHPSGHVNRLMISGQDTDHIKYRYHAGYDERWRSVGRMAVVEAEENLYFYRDITGANPVSFDVDNHIAMVQTGFQASAENGGAYTSKPTFLAITGEKFNAGAFADLDRVVFP